MADLSNIKALCFDVFGTVVDWRGTIIREGAEWSRDYGLDVDWAAFADAWRAGYDPAMARVRSGERPWIKLDVLHRENLLGVLDAFAITSLGEADIDHINRVWHRLDPWPDAVAGLARLKTRYILATLSNGNVAIMVNMARNAGLPWDAILGAEVAGAYKPEPKAYLSAADMLGVEATECMMAAAHNYDLIASSKHGFRTAFVNRPLEFGFGKAETPMTDAGFDIVAEDFGDLADRLGC
ncbi:MAG: haloacid dehalogenase type II [Rhodospirillales bacterium]|nr:haloacid dehalogenase type II [Rhodospirillales bacterium]